MTDAPSGEPADEPEDSLYRQVGGETTVRAIVDRFYDLMDLEPDYARIRALHPADLSGSREKLFLFLCGWMGGPQRYVERYGHPMLRARHLPYPIASTERDQWLVCMGRALLDCEVPEPLFERLLQGFYQTADWMRNREG